MKYAVKKPTGRLGGRPEAIFDWEEVEWMMLSGATGTEIAAAFGAHENTFYINFQKHYSCGFSGALHSMREAGKGWLRSSQYKEAHYGNTALLMRLGEVMLGQGKEAVQTNAESENDLVIRLAKLETQNKELQDKLDAIESKTSSVDKPSDTQI